MSRAELDHSQNNLKKQRLAFIERVRTYGVFGARIFHLNIYCAV